MSSFTAAKKVLPQIYAELEAQYGQQSTIYCGCPIDLKQSGKKISWTVDLDACGYEARKNRNRASRIEVEHVMAAWEFGHQMKCWQEGGRKQCSKDQEFKKMEGDLHNLYPSVGEVNGDRGNFQFTDMGAKPNQYGKCEMVVDFKRKLAQPPKASRGEIARAHLYMSQEYGIKLSNQQRRLYEAWNRMYPASRIECTRNQLIQKHQGNLNPFVTESCKVQKFE